MTNYAGVVPRQALVDFCQTQVKTLIAENGSLSEDADTLEAAGHISTAHSIREQLQHNYGQQRAMRDVCEWAKEHVEDDLRA